MSNQSPVMTIQELMSINSHEFYQQLIADIQGYGINDDMSWNIFINNYIKNRYKKSR